MPRGPQVRSLDPKPRCDRDLEEPFSFLVFGDLVVGNLTMSLFPVGQTKESFIYSLFSCCVIRIYSLLIPRPSEKKSPPKAFKGSS
jgi:hypothetical protein